MAAEWSRSQSSVEIWISNDTRSFTLKDPRTFFRGGQSSVPPSPELPPGSSDSCRFSSDPDSPSITGFMFYEAESFTLAIFVIAPGSEDDCPHVLRLELSLAKAHLDDLRDTFYRMVLGLDLPAGPENTVSHCEFLEQSRAAVGLSAGPVKATATMSRGPGSLVKVVLSEWGDSVEDPARQQPCRFL